MTACIWYVLIKMHESKGRIYPSIVVSIIIALTLGILLGTASFTVYVPFPAFNRQGFSSVHKSIVLLMGINPSNLMLTSTSPPVTSSPTCMQTVKTEWSA